jgi:hypothetical protein
MGLSGRVSRNGLLPLPGPVTRIVEGNDRCGVGRVASATLGGAEFAGVPLIGERALGKCTGREFVGGAFRAIGSADSLSSGLAAGLSESVKDRVAVAEDGSTCATREDESSGGAWRD